MNPLWTLWTRSLYSGDIHYISLIPHKCHSNQNIILNYGCHDNYSNFTWPSTQNISVTQQSKIQASQWYKTCVSAYSKLLQQIVRSMTWWLLQAVHRVHRWRSYENRSGISNLLVTSKFAVKIRSKASGDSEHKYPPIRLNNNRFYKATVWHCVISFYVGKPVIRMLLMALFT